MIIWNNLLPRGYMHSDRRAGGRVGERVRLIRGASIASAPRVRPLAESAGAAAAAE
jgi:hypothetical protein